MNMFMHGYHNWTRCAVCLLNDRRPGFDRKVKEMLGNELFKDPYPAPGDCSGVGSSITGHCPKVIKLLLPVCLSG
jgi:hypothetical protein